MFKFFKALFLHKKYTKILKKVYKEENLLENLSQLFGTNFKIDWIGRIYAVINPSITNGEYDNNTIIYEYNEYGLNTNSFVEQKIMEKLHIASNYIAAKNLFDLLTYKIQKIDDYGNYLFIIQPITLSEYIKSIKIILIELGIIGVLICSYFMFL